MEEQVLITAELHTADDGTQEIWLIKHDSMEVISFNASVWQRIIRQKKFNTCGWTANACRAAIRKVLK